MSTERGTSPRPGGMKPRNGLNRHRSVLRLTAKLRSPIRKRRDRDAALLRELTEGQAGPRSSLKQTQNVGPRVLLLHANSLARHRIGGQVGVMLAGVAIVYACGVPWLARVMGLSFREAIIKGAGWFAVLDAAKVLAAAGISTAILPKPGDARA